MAKLSTKKQIAVKIEALEGVAESLSASDGGYLVYDPKFSPDVQMFTRNPVRQTLSKMGKLPGIKSANATFKLELRGSGVATTSPTWFKMMKACGFDEHDVYSIGIGTVSSGPFKHLEIITGGTSNATAYVVYDTVDGVTTLYLIPISGTLQDAEVITGARSGATATTSGTPIAFGKALKPTSKEDIPSLTIGAYEDGIRKLIKGSRGKAQFLFKAGEPSMMDFDFKGVLSEIADVPFLTGINYDETVPPTFLDAKMTMNEYSAVFSELELHWGNSLAAIENANDSAGIQCYRIADRDALGTFNAEMVAVSEHDFFGRWFNNSKNILDFQIGTIAGNRFRFIAPYASYSSIEDVDKDNIQYVNTSFELEGGFPDGDDELLIVSF